MAIDKRLRRWIDEADEDERRDALIRFEGGVDVGDVAHFLEVKGVTISEVMDTGDALVNFTPGGLRDIMDEEWVAAVLEPPPGTGEPGHPGKPLED